MNFVHVCTSITMVGLCLSNVQPGSRWKPQQTDSIVQWIDLFPIACNIHEMSSAAPACSVSTTGSLGLIVSKGAHCEIDGKSTDTVPYKQCALSTFGWTKRFTSTHQQ